MSSSQHYFVHVKGDIILKDHTIQCAQNWVCCGPVSSNNENDYYPQNPTDISTNLYLGEDRACIPYAIYVSESGISGGGITLWPGYGPAIVYAKNEIERIRKATDIEVFPEIENSYYKGLYIECFSCLEQFLCDFVLCGIYNVHGCYDRAELFRNNKEEKKICILSILHSFIIISTTFQICIERF